MSKNSIGQIALAAVVTAALGLVAGPAFAAGEGLRTSATASPKRGKRLRQHRRHALLRWPHDRQLRRRRLETRR